VSGLPDHVSRALGGVALKRDEWQAALRVSVSQDGGGPERPAIAGRYRVSDGAIEFTPAFPFDPGRRYDVVFDAARLPAAAGWADAPAIVRTAVALPARTDASVTRVAAIHPGSAVVPENQLRLYVEFSGPMGRQGGLEFIQLLDDHRHPVIAPFLPLDADFWNEDRTRYTLFFDPGRVKRGILPNEQMGRALRAGERYTLVVDQAWRDAQGLPLAAPFEHTFRAGPADMRPLDSAAWKIATPAAGTRDVLTVSFPEPLDHGLLLRALGVRRGDGPVAGDAAAADGDTRWTFTPRDPWTMGEYSLFVLTILEDLAGNRIGRAFEVDQFERVDAVNSRESIAIPFRIDARHDGTSEPER
jgi:hypothetical protein